MIMKKREKRKKKTNKWKSKGEWSKRRINGEIKVWKRASSPGMKMNRQMNAEGN